VTALIVGTRTDVWRLHVVFVEPPERDTLAGVTGKLAGLRDLMVATYWIQLSRARRMPLELQPRYSLDDGLRLGRLTYTSPLDVLIEISPYAGTGVVAARGLVYIMSRWEDCRAKRAWTNYYVASYALLTNTLPDPRDNPKRAREQLLQESEKDSAAKVLPFIKSVELEEPGS
jgi:hypothetical protein